ncbi:cholinesterase 2-like [Eriocheir sinensis]|uniref:Carboxylic ester hydrolase n=1 Tax=Eriocheir sinensis TaxID=95602 RepID=A0A1L5JHT6_ERISI|nr:cholinesterase 2-like [Eriocheir sinensis]XP_050727494.1 cholinesterase 2-like [Eriocheir sinensis]XP_050727495.1 cholinesterase 2-like [Eriocheir sinensis]APO14259.1 juvenile hormone esterase-like carboxylesterase 1 [Eriocheir sinensis]
MRLIATAVVVVVLVAVKVVAAAGEATATEVPLVETEGGRVSGILEESLKGREFYSFYGIPFAQPPVGKLRFKDPAAPSPWEGTRNASVPPAACPQYDFSGMMSEPFAGQEDCLYLNVFTPKTKEEGGLPVMVWIHGGAFFSGSATEYRPHVLLNHDVVLVVVQYRLGVLGFLSTEDSVMPGNLGLKDQTMALQWVQRNIHRFGGDKTRVTIFGESAGGASVHYQMLTPKTEGLFSRAILQSGAALCPWSVNTNPRKAALRVASIVGCPADQGSHALLECLQGLDAVTIVPLFSNFFEWNMLPFAFTPWVDGEYLPEQPEQLALKGRYAQVDIMAGVTRDEGALFVIAPLREKKVMEQIQNNFSVAGPASLALSGQCDDPVAVARQVYLHYSGTTHVTEAHAESLNRMYGDRHFAVCHDLTTALHAAHHHPTKKTFRYELQHRGQFSLLNFMCPSCSQDWVCHGDDLFYLFPGGPIPAPLSSEDLQRPDDLAVRDIIVALWTNFAITGNPTPDDSLGFKWEPSTADSLHYLSLTPSPSMQPDDRKDARKFHNSLPTTLNMILHPDLVEGGASEPQDDGYDAKTEL